MHRFRWMTLYAIFIAVALGCAIVVVAAFRTPG